MRAAPAAVGFCCRGGTALLVAVPVPEPGRGEVGGLLAVLLASLKNRQQKMLLLAQKNEVILLYWCYMHAAGSQLTKNIFGT